jgi:hypothetical protein
MEENNTQTQTGTDMKYESPEVVDYGSVEQITKDTWKGGLGTDQDVQIPEGQLGSQYADSPGDF